MQNNLTQLAKDQTIEIIDCTPTWRGILPLYLTVLKDGNKTGKQIAKDELLNMAKVADMYVSMTKQKAINMDRRNTRYLLATKLYKKYLHLVNQSTSKFAFVPKYKNALRVATNVLNQF